MKRFVAPFLVGLFGAPALAILGGLSLVALFFASPFLLCWGLGKDMIECYQHKPRPWDQDGYDKGIGL